MPPRTYDFSNYQGPGEALLSGVGGGFSAVDNLLRQRRQDRQNADLLTLEEQQILDQINRARIEAGGQPLGQPTNPTTNPTGGQRGTPVGPAAQGGQAPQATPTSTGASDIAAPPGATPPFAPAPDAGGGLLGRVRAIRSRVGSMLAGGPSTLPQLSSFAKTGPNAAESLASAQHGYAMGEIGLRNQGDVTVANIHETAENERARLLRAIEARRIGAEQQSTYRTDLIARVNLHNATINDLQDQVKQLEVTKKNLNPVQFNGDLRAFQQAQTEIDSQVASYNERIMQAIQDRAVLMQQLDRAGTVGDIRPGGGQATAPATPTAAAPTNPADRMQQLAKQAQAAIAAGADPQAVQQRLNAALNALVGAALGNDTRQPRFGHKMR